MISDMTQTGIPQSAANPLEAELNRPWEEAQAKQAEQMNAWRKKSRDRLDSAVLDWDGFTKANPMDLSFAPDAESAKRQVITSAFLAIANDGREVPTDELGAMVMRDRVAEERFGGRGVGDDNAFFGEIVKDTTDRKAKNGILEEVIKAAQADEMLPMDKRAGMKAALDAVRGKPGFSGDAEAAEAWQAASDAIRARTEPFRDELELAWMSMTNGANIPSEAIAGIDDKDFPDFIMALRMRAEAMPDKEKETYLAAMRKSFVQYSETAVRQTGEGFTSAALAQTTPYQAAAGGVGMFTGSEEKRLQAQAANDRMRNRSHEVRNIIEGKFDVIDYADNVFLRGIQKTPGTVVSFAQMAVPIAGQVAMSAQMMGAAQESLYLKYRGQGLSEADAGNFSSTLAPAVMIPQMLLEKAQFGLVANKLPFLSKALNAVGDRISNRALRFATKAGIITGAESSVEVMQDFTQSVVEEIAHELQPEIPGVDLSKEFAGAWQQFPEIAASMLLLGVFGAAGGMNAEARNAAFAEASPRQLLAYGLTTDQIAEVIEAKTQGASSLSAKLDEVLPLRDANSPGATEAAAELAAEVKAQEAAVAEGQKSGVYPVFTRTADGWSVTDGETGEWVGSESTWQGALRLGTAHSAMIDEKNADQVAYLATVLQAGETTMGYDNENRKTGFTFNPGQKGKVTAADGTVVADFELTPANEARILAQSKAKGGTFTATVLGQSVTTFKQNVRNTVNRIMGSGSVLTVFHEEGHGFFREALQSGRLTKDSTVETIRFLQQSFVGKKTKAGEDIQFLPAEGAVTDEQLDEAVAELMEVLVLKNRKKTGYPAKMVSDNLSAIARRHAPTKAFKDFMDTLREFFGVVFSRAYELKKAIKDGKVKEADIEAFTNKLFGLDQQDEHDAAAVAARDEMLGEGDPFSLGKEPRRSASSMAEAEAAAKEFVGTPLSNKADGLVASVSGNGLRKMVSGSAVDSSSSRASHAFALANLDSLFESAVRTHSGADRASDPNIAAMHRYYAPFFHGGEVMLAKITVKEMAMKADGNRIYSVQALDVVKPATTAASSISENRQNYVALAGFEEKLQQRIDEVKLSGQSSFSLGPARMAEALADEAIARIKDPKARMRVMTKVAGNMGQLKRDRDEIGVAFGKDFKRSAIEDPRKTASIRKERNMREAIRRVELEDEAHARHGGILHTEDLDKLRAQPIHGYLADPTNKLRGRLMSQSVAAGKGKSFFDPEKQGDFDGAGAASRTLFGGQLMPDQAAQELFDAGLIKDPTPDAMWDALAKEAKTVARMKEFMAAASADLKKARLQAKEEATAWEWQRLKQEKKDYSPKARLLRALAMLDGIISALPIAERGRVGGYTQLAKLDSDEARLKFLTKRIEKVDEVLENWMVKEYGRMFDKLLERAKPVKGKAGEKPKGKTGATVHALFDKLREARGWSQDKTDQHVDGLLSVIAAGNLTPEQEAHDQLEANLVGLVGNWKDADATRRAAAVEAATKVFEAGYAKFKLANLLKAEDRKIRGKALRVDTGKTGDAGERDAKLLADHGLRGGWKDNFLSLISFEQLTEYIFGRNSEEARRIVDMEREAAAMKEDALQADMDGLDELFTRLGGSQLAGEKIRWELSQKSLKIGGRQLSPLEAITATLMWRQPDGQRHMLGHKDENGNYAGKWHYDQDFIDKIEAALSDDAKAVRAHISAEYAAEWAQINPTFVELNGINLPQNPNYSPLTVKPQQASAGQMVDQVTGSTMSGSSTTPGSLRSRGQAIAEPEFRDALQTFIAHRKQIRHWIAYAPFNAEAGTIMRNRDLGNAVEAKGGDQALSILRGWLDFFAVGGVRDASAHLSLNQLMNRMSGRAASSILIGRMGVIMIQATQLGAAIAEMPTGSFAMRFAKLLAGQLGWGAAHRSEYIQRRVKQMPVVVQQAMEGLKSSKPNQLKHQVQRLGRMIGGMDALMTAGTFAMVHDYQLKQAKALGLTGAEADAYAMKAAERSVDRIAQPTRPGTRSLYENAATNPAVRVLWSFASESRQKLVLGLWRAASKDRTLGEKTRALAVTWVIGGMFATMIRSAWRDMRDDDDEETFDEKNWGLKRLTLSTLTGPMGGLPFLGDALEAGVYKVAGEYLPEGNLLSSLPNALASIPKFFEALSDGDVEKVMKTTEALLAGAAFMNDSLSAASSLSHLARDLFGIADNFTGD